MTAVLIDLFPPKGKDHKNTLEFCLQVFAKTKQFEGNCMEIGYLLFKILRFYALNLAANGGRHFEINNESSKL